MWNMSTIIPGNIVFFFASLFWVAVEGQSVRLKNSNRRLLFAEAIVSL